MKNIEQYIVSLNTSEIKEIEWSGRKIRTGIFKNPIEQKLAVKSINKSGYEQADQNAHGGVNKAIYAYPVEH